MALTKADSASKTPTPIEIEVPPSFENAIVFGHRDADGHLAAEQTRDYLVQNGLRVTTVVSSLTGNYNFWKRLPTIDLSGYELVVFVDIAFRFSNPGESLDYLLKVADGQGGKRFIAIDHHLIPRPEWERGNLELYEVSDPLRLLFGPAQS